MTSDHGVTRRESDERDRDERYSRQILAFGVETQRRLASLRVGVVGVGGAGSLVVQGLAHLGVGRLVVVDPDTVETSNLSRIAGSTPADAARAVPKVDVASRLARSVNPGIQVEAVCGSILDTDVWRALRQVDVIIGAVDAHAPRWAMNLLAIQYNRTYIDLAVEITRDRPGSADAGSLEVGGRVAVVRPDGPCLLCQAGYDPALAARERDPFTLTARRAAGYVTAGSFPAPIVPTEPVTPGLVPAWRARAAGHVAPTTSPAADPACPSPASAAPSVMFLNYAVASLALAELVNSVSPWRNSRQQILFDLVRPAMLNLDADLDPVCPACGPGSVRGDGDSGGDLPAPPRSSPATPSHGGM